MSYQVSDEEWRDLLAALNLKGPVAEYKILKLAAERIRQLEGQLQDEHKDCIRVAHEVLPEAILYYAHQSAWAMAAEIRRLRAMVKD